MVSSGGDGQGEAAGVEATPASGDAEAGPSTAVAEAAVPKPPAAAAETGQTDRQAADQTADQTAGQADAAVTGTSAEAAGATPGETSAGDAAAGAHGANDAPADAPPMPEGQQQAGAGEVGDKGKRKRKRRRKRKGAASSAGDVDAPAEGEAKGEKRRESAAPFARYFAGGATKRHAFAVGEVVAGRVQRLEDGAIVVDLFGKAVAVADEFEPREVPPPQVVEAPPKTDPAEGAEGGQDAGAAPATADAATDPSTAVTAVGGLAAPDLAAAEAGATPGSTESTQSSESEESGESGESEEPAASGQPATQAAEPSEPAAQVGSTATSAQVGAPTDSASPSESAGDAAAVEAPADAGGAAAGAAVQPPASASTPDAPASLEAPVEPGAEAARQAIATDAADVASAPSGSVVNPAAAEASQPPGDAPASGDAVTDSASDSASDAASDAARGPLPPAPVVPEGLPRPEPPKLGGIFKGRVGAVAESGHIVLLNRHVDRPAVREAIKQYREQRRRVEGLVFGYNRGGFDVLVEGIRAFCPASAMALGEIPDPEALVGRKYEFLLPAGKGGKDIVVSRRSILERQARKRAKELARSLEPGQRFSGKVTSVREFGLFVDIGGIEGLVHQSEISHAFGVKPASVAQAGDTVEVQVLRVGDAGKKGKKDGKTERRDRTTRVSLSMKALLPDPWDAHAEAIAEGSVREGKVTRTTEFGAFIELAPDIEGLLHISEFGRDLTHADQATKEGETLHVIVERADRKARRISLSRLVGAELEDYKNGNLDPAAIPRNLRPGAKVNVRVDKADHRGVQVRLPGAIGRRARGFIPAGETGTERGTDLRKRFPAGQDLEVKVIGNDRDGGLKCSIKALQIDEERRAVKDYRREASKQGFGTFGDLLKAKLGQ